MSLTPMHIKKLRVKQVMTEKRDRGLVSSAEVPKLVCATVPEFVKKAGLFIYLYIMITGDNGAESSIDVEGEKESDEDDKA